MTIRFQYVGHSGETIVGMQPVDLSAEDYDALDYDHQQAVLINRGSDGAPLYVEVHEPPATLIEAAPDAPAVFAPPTHPLDQSAPAEGANH